VDTKSEISAFLKAHRRALTPKDVGIAPGSRRRLTGLRREEVAVLAGISVEYYTLLERGRLPHATDQVIEAVGRALKLDEADYGYMWTLARGLPKAATPPEITSLESLAGLPKHFHGGAALLITNVHDVIGLNGLARALLAPIMPDGPFNLAREICLNPASRGLWGRWEKAAHDMASMLRMDSAMFPDDPEPQALAEELREACPEFRLAWDNYEAGYRTPEEFTFNHPQAGRIVFDVAPFVSRMRPSCQLVLFFPQPGYEAAMAKLTQIAAATAADCIGV
jgi:transcriptional regulator with XRE-family HTH domain